jgi:SDR family mycofactocin-dependent oxidoreductase
MTSRLAVVTGAARGIGAAVAGRLAADGWSLLLVDACAPQPGIGYAMPAPEDLAAVARACVAAGAPRADELIGDVGDGAIRDQIRLALGDRVPSAAVAAAGIIAGHPAWAVPDDVFGLMIRVNLLGVRHLADACVPAMIEAGHGRLVAISSAAALRAMPELAAYSAAKSAVVGYVRALAADLAGTGVTANVVCPGSTRGAMLAASAAIYDLPDQEAFAAQALLRRILDPAEVAAAVCWLCGPDATAVTGAVIPVDAGLSALATGARPKSDQPKSLRATLPC